MRCDLFQVVSDASVLKDVVGCLEGPDTLHITFFSSVGGEGWGPLFWGLLEVFGGF